MADFDTSSVTTVDSLASAISSAAQSISESDAKGQGASSSQSSHPQGGAQGKILSAIFFHGTSISGEVGGSQPMDEIVRNLAQTTTSLTADLQVDEDMFSRTSQSGYSAFTATSVEEEDEEEVSESSNHTVLMIGSEDLGSVSTKDEDSSEPKAENTAAPRRSRSITGRIFSGLKRLF